MVSSITPWQWSRDTSRVAMGLWEKWREVYFVHFGLRGLVAVWDGGDIDTYASENNTLAFCQQVLRKTIPVHMF